MAKPTPETIPSDDFELLENGETLKLHEGESVKVLRRRTVAELKAGYRLYRLGVELAALEGEPDGDERALARLDESRSDMLGALRGRIIAWTWTDDLGKPHPQPDGTDGPLLGLRIQELWYLIGLVNGEAPAEEKKG